MPAQSSHQKSSLGVSIGAALALSCLRASVGLLTWLPCAETRAEEPAPEPAAPAQKGKPKAEPYDVPRGGRFWLHDDRAGEGQAR